MGSYEHSMASYEKSYGFLWQFVCFSMQVLLNKTYVLLCKFLWIPVEVPVCSYEHIDVVL